MSIIPQKLLDRVFHISVAIKGIDGILEICGGLLLFFIPLSSIEGIGKIAIVELQASHHLIIADLISRLNSHLTTDVALIGAIYLLVHGIIKLLLATALFRDIYKLYPLAMALLTISILFQTYRVGLDHSLILALLTLFDIFIVWMTFLEWKRHPVRRSRMKLRSDEDTANKNKVSMVTTASTKKTSKSTKVIFIGTFTIIALLSAAAIASNQLAYDAITKNIDAPRALTDEYSKTYAKTIEFRDLQKKNQVQIVRDAEIQNSLDQIQLDIANSQYSLADKDMKELNAKLTSWNKSLANYINPKPTQYIKPQAGIASTDGMSKGSYLLPILLYHLTPANFDAQLTHLEQRGYTTIDFAQLTSSFRGGPALPAKPIILTFDDGFTDQLKAFEILKRHNMKATFYIINGGSASRWCLGAGRRFGDPLQPPAGCGDAYMNWDQVRMLDKSGIITIGAHTVDHENLAGDNAAQQNFEIVNSKLGIEKEIGHKIFDFCYPYGAYNATTIQIVKSAGFATATTTISGIYQPVGDFYTLRRIRDTLTLP